MKCSKCHFQNPEDSKFCLECGGKFELKCPHCGKLLPVTAKFCNECGNDTSKPIESASIDYSKPQSYTPKHLTDKILTTRSSIEGERKLVTVLFADVANYTRMTEKVGAEEAHYIMDGCFKVLMDEIHKFEGTINQFTGDGVMALFGAPISHEDHAQRGCRAALEIQKAVIGYKEKIEQDYDVQFNLRIGLNSGPVIVGAIGNDLRMDYTAVGDTTNLGSRMESAAHPGTILVSGNTYKLVKEFFKFEALGEIEVKGKEEPQKVFKLIKTGEVRTRIGAAMAKGLTQFVGRKNSMAALMSAFNKVKSGSGQVVGLVGEAGVGKSRLLLEMRNVLPTTGHNYHEGRCIHFGSSMAYLPILDILRSFFGVKEGDQESNIKKKIKKIIIDLDEKLNNVIPPFQELLSLKVNDEEWTKLEPKEKRDRTFEALRDLMLRGSEEKPLVIAIEDLHWIDKTSEEFLNYVIEWLANKAILLILLYRPEYMHQWGSKSYYRKIGLDQLGPQSSAELVRAILEGGEMTPELTELILDRATGNPLFLEEFTHTLIEMNYIEKKDRKFALRKNAKDVQVPDTINGIILARMDRLEDNLKRTMQVASVIGRDFAFRILQTITGMQDELKSYLLNLQGLEFIYEKRLFPELEYIFKHSLIQEVAYNSLLAKRRSEIHQKIGEAIETLYTHRLEEFYEMLGYHYSKSDSIEKAYQYLKLSGRKSEKNYSYWEALTFYKDAIKALKKLPRNDENKIAEIEIRILIANSLITLGYPENSLQILQKGEKLAKEMGDDKSLALFQMFIANLYNFKGDPLLAIEYAENSFEKGKQIQYLEVMTPMAFILCNSYWASGQLSKTVTVAQDIINLLEKRKRKDDFFNFPLNPYSSFCAFYGLGLGYLGNFKEGITFCEKSITHATEIGHLISMGFSEFACAAVFRAVGDGYQVKIHAQNSIKYFEEAQWLFGLGLSSVELGCAYYHLGEFSLALKQLKKGLKIQEESGVKAYLSSSYRFLGMLYCDSGHFKKAQECAERALKLSQKNNESHLEGASWILLGRIYLDSSISQTDKAEKFILKGINILEELKIPVYLAIGYLYLGKLYVNLGQKKEALKNLTAGERAFRKMNSDFWLALTYSAYADMLRREGDLSKTKEYLYNAIDIFKKLTANGWVKKYEEKLAKL